MSISAPWHGVKGMIGHSCCPMSLGMTEDAAHLWPVGHQTHVKRLQASNRWVVGCETPPTWRMGANPGPLKKRSGPSRRTWLRQVAANIIGQAVT
jgi:hypothetical protein